MNQVYDSPNFIVFIITFDWVPRYHLVVSVLQPKKSAKVKPRSPVSPHPFSSSLGPSSTRHHHRPFRSLPNLNHPRQSNAQLPPIANHISTDPSFPPTATTSAHSSIPRRPPPSFSSPASMLPEEETCPPFAKIRPPPKVSRLDIGSTRLMGDCVYPQLPPLCIRGPPEASFDPAEPAGEAVGLGLLDEATGLVVPTQPGAPFGELSDPLSLDVSNPTEGGHRSLEVGPQHQMSLSPSPLSTWTLGTTDTLTSRADRTVLGISFHISPRSPLPISVSTSTSCLQPNVQAQSSAQSKRGKTSPLPSIMSTHSPCLRGAKVESHGKRPEIISKREARGITKMADQACKEPLGSVNNSDLLASLSSRALDSSDHRDSHRESLGLELASPPSTSSGQVSLYSRLPTTPNSRFLQDDLTRQMSPLHRAAASYMVSTAMVASEMVHVKWFKWSVCLF